MSKIITTPDGRVLEPVTPSNDLQKLQEISEKLISDTTYQQILNNNTSMNMFDYMQKFPSPEERLKFLENQTESMRKIQYENMKLNVQIEIQNKTLDSNLEELNRLRTVNTELKAVNKNLENSNRHYWRNTTIISFVVALIFYLLGFITP